MGCGNVFYVCVVLPVAPVIGGMEIVIWDQLFSCRLRAGLTIAGMNIRVNALIILKIPIVSIDVIPL
jgi:hypothetical protein